MNNAQRVPQVSNLELMYRAYRLIGLSHGYHSWANTAASKNLIPRLQSESICSERETDHPVYNYALERLSKAYRQIADDVRKFQGDLSLAARQEDHKVVRLARQCLSDLASEGRSFNTDLVVFTFEYGEERLQRLVEIRFRRILESMVASLGHPRSTLTYLPMNDEDEDECTVRAHITPHPDLPAALQGVCADAMKMTDNDELSVDILHISFANTNTLTKEIDKIDTATLSKLSDNFDQWCIDNNVMTYLEDLVPGVFMS